MKRLILGLLVSTQFVAAMEITMPGRSVLRKRLNDAGMSFFVDTTNIIPRLADKTKHPLSFAVAIELSIIDYLEYLEKIVPASMMREYKAQMEMYKPRIFEVVFQDEPAALEGLIHWLIE